MRSILLVFTLLTLLASSCTDSGLDRESSGTSESSQPLSITDGLIHHWKLDGDGLDQVGGLHGLEVGVAVAPGQVDDALDFSGSAYVDLGTTNTSADTMSVTAWASADCWACGNTSGDARVISVANGTSEQDHQLMLSGLNGNLRCRLKAGGTTKTVIGGSTRFEWQHVACTYDGATLTLWDNGVAVASTSHTGVVGLTRPGAIGRNPVSNSHYFDGLIDDVRIYSRALNQGDINDIINWRPPTGPLDAGVPLDGGADSGTDGGADASVDDGAGGTVGVGGATGEGGSCGTAGGGSGGEEQGGAGGAGGAGGSGGEATGGSGGACEVCENCEACETCQTCEICETCETCEVAPRLTIFHAGDFGYPGDNTSSKFLAWLNMMEAATSAGGQRYLAVLTGDLAYEETPVHTWFDLFASKLPHVAVIATKGNHEDVLAWQQYEERIAQHNASFDWLQCVGPFYGVNSRCEVPDNDLSFVLSDVVQLGWRERTDWIETQLAESSGAWKFCLWHETRDEFTTGSKATTVPEEPYQACQAAGAAVLNSHDHNYTRSCTISDILNPENGADCTGALRVGGGETAVIVSGRGGRNMSGFSGANAATAAWANTNACSSNGVSCSSGGSVPGVVTITMGGSIPPNRAIGAYLGADNQVLDRFEIERVQ